MPRLSNKAVLGEGADRAGRESIGGVCIGPAVTNFHRASLVDGLFKVCAFMSVHHTACLFMALFGHAVMSNLSPLSGAKRKTSARRSISPFDPKRTNGHVRFCPAIGGQ